MKNLRVLFLICVLPLFFASCEKDDENTEEINSMDDIPSNKASFSAIDGMKVMFPADPEASESRELFKAFKEEEPTKLPFYSYDSQWNFYLKANDTVCVSLRKTSDKVDKSSLSDYISEEILMYEGQDEKSFGKIVMTDHVTYQFANVGLGDKLEFKRTLAGDDGKDVNLLYDVYYIYNDKNGCLYNISVSRPAVTAAQYEYMIKGILDSVKFE